ncbi:hypothetical protein NQD34_000973, partial [Periophthalmus magnuspinnatus]
KQDVLHIVLHSAGLVSGDGATARGTAGGAQGQNRGVTEWVVFLQNLHHLHK